MGNISEKMEDEIIKRINRDEDSITITLENEKNGVFGFARIEKNVELNNIYVEVKRDYRSNGYGKLLFNEALKEYYNNYGGTELTFKVMNDNFIVNIIGNSNGINIANNNGVLKFVVPLKNIKQSL